MSGKIPTNIHLHKKSQELEVSFGKNQSFRLPSEYLRVLSPSAEVRGHGKPILQVGKKYVQITGIEMVGSYAIKIIFSDGHDSGIFDWNYLYDLGVNQDQHWEGYLRQLHKADESRDPDASVVRLV